VKKSNYAVKYRIFFLLFYFYPVLSHLKTLVSQFVAQSFKQPSSVEVYFIRNNLERISAYNVIKTAHLQFKEVLKEKKKKKTY